MRYTLAPAVKRDLDEIAAWIAEDNPARAVQVVRRLRAEFRKIARQPMLYRLRTEIDEDARLASTGHHVILFRIQDGAVHFERVVYGGRDLPPLFDPEE